MYILENTKTGLQYSGVSGREEPHSRFREHCALMFNVNFLARTLLYTIFGSANVFEASL